MLLRCIPSSTRLWAHTLARPDDVPPNGAAMRLATQRERDDGTGKSWRYGVSLEDVEFALCCMAHAIAPETTSSWTVIAQYAYRDEGDGRGQGPAGYSHRETGEPWVGGLRVLYRRPWYCRLFGVPGPVRVQAGEFAPAGEWSWRETSEFSETSPDTRLPLPSERDVEVLIGGDEVSMLSPFHHPNPMQPGYTKRVEETSTWSAALWLLCLVWHGYMTRSGQPTARFTPTPSEAVKS